MPASLETELKTYEAHKHELLAEEGKFVVVHGADILGIYGTYEDALKVGYEKCKLEPFLVKKIQVVEPVNFVSRDISLECLTSPSR